MPWRLAATSLTRDLVAGLSLGLWDDQFLVAKEWGLSWKREVFIGAAEL